MRAIYSITNKINNKKYIGETYDIKTRWNLHIRNLEDNNHHSYKLQKEWNLYGAENFKFEIEKVIKNEYCKYLSKILLICYEKFLIEKYNSIRTGYNIENTFEKIKNKTCIPIGEHDLGAINIIYEKINYNYNYNFDEYNEHFLFKNSKINTEETKFGNKEEKSFIKEQKEKIKLNDKLEEEKSKLSIKEKNSKIKLENNKIFIENIKLNINNFIDENKENIFFKINKLKTLSNAFEYINIKSILDTLYNLNKIEIKYKNFINSNGIESEIKEYYSNDINIKNHIQYTDDGISYSGISINNNILKIIVDLIDYENSLYIVYKKNLS